MDETNPPAESGAAEPAGGRARALLVLALAALAAVAVVFGLRHVPPEDPRWLLWAGAALAGLGLLALYALLAGVLRLGSGKSERQFLDGLASAVGHPLVVTDADGRALYANAAYHALVKRAGTGRLVPMDVLFTPYAEFSGPIYQLSQAVAAGRRETRELRVAEGGAAPCADPVRPVWIRLSAAPMPAGGRTLRLWELEDISGERARQEQSFARLQFIITYLDNAPVGFFSTLADGRVDYVNATLAQWLGMDLGDLEGANLTLQGLIGPTAARLIAGIAPKPRGAATESFGIDLRNPGTGKLFPVQIIHHVDFDAEGRASPARTIVVPRQLVESAAAGGEISAPRLARFINNAPIGIAEVGKDGIIRTANPAFIDLSLKLRRGAELAGAIAAPERGQLQQTLAAALAEEGSQHQLEATLEGDSPRSVLFTFTRLSGDDGAAVVFAVDKTENKSLAVQLAQSQKLMAVGQLASGIAHDFNNVLTPIIGFADLLLAKMRPTDPAFADVMNIKQNANRAANLVRQLLAFSRKQTLQPKVHVLTEALSDLGNLLGRVLGEKVGLKISHERDLGLVMVDIHQFEQVIINLAVNARDAMPNGGTLTVRTYNIGPEASRAIMPSLMPPGDYVVCEVEDTGTGIPKEIRDKIWEPFFST